MPYIVRLFTDYVKDRWVAQERCMGIRTWASSFDKDTAYKFETEQQANHIASKHFPDYQREAEYVEGVPDTVDPVQSNANSLQWRAQLKKRTNKKHIL